MEGIVWVVSQGVVVLFVVILVPVRGTGSIGYPSCALPTLGEVLIMANLATNSNKVRIILMVLSRRWGVARHLLPTQSRQAPLEVELQVKTVTNAVDSVQAVADSVDLSTEGFDGGMSVTELLGNGEYLGILERAVGAFLIPYTLSFRI